MEGQQGRQAALRDRDEGPLAVRHRRHLGELDEVEVNLLALERQEAAILRGLDSERLALRRPDMNFQAALEIE